VGSKTSPFCHDATVALRTRDGERLFVELSRYLAAAEPTLELDYRDVLVGLAPYVDCAVRLGIDPVKLFDRAAASVGPALRETVRTFARRSDVTLEAFGWRLLQMSDGPCYRPDAG
jgi:hypothetical protein